MDSHHLHHWRCCLVNWCHRSFGRVSFNNGRQRASCFVSLCDERQTFENFHGITDTDCYWSGFYVLFLLTWRFWRDVDTVAVVEFIDTSISDWLADNYYGIN